MKQPSQDLQPSRVSLQSGRKKYDDSRRHAKAVYSINTTSKKESKDHSRNAKPFFGEEDSPPSPLKLHYQGMQKPILNPETPSPDDGIKFKTKEEQVQFNKTMVAKQLLVSGPQKYIDSSGTKLRGDTFVDLMGKDSIKMTHDERSRKREGSV
eukprot:CAMPEP_0170543850 /NCGR_PEP_ID=MMETSP0211-20121228/2825_1 /TAXON_ID=311385 /ORGANISM="Pseudokeronopsis sp., Strain OXSARD2" /LENGTH=152 /DNA_ID=CAMNT_0010847343 /DNA_START=1126 /DNA_END=1584 /DNA_ORIENTATION=+